MQGRNSNPLPSDSASSVLENFCWLYLWLWTLIFSPKNRKEKIAVLRAPGPRWMLKDEWYIGWMTGAWVVMQPLSFSSQYSIIKCRLRALNPGIRTCRVQIKVQNGCCSKVINRRGFSYAYFDNRPVKGLKAGEAPISECSSEPETHSFFFFFQRHIL